VFVGQYAAIAAESVPTTTELGGKYRMLRKNGIDAATDVTASARIAALTEKPMKMAALSISISGCQTETSGAGHMSAVGSIPSQIRLLSILHLPRHEIMNHLLAITSK